MSARVSSGKDSKQNYGTPRPLFHAIQNHFQCTVDLAADESNHKCDVWFGLGGRIRDAFAARWEDWACEGKWLWLNPPYNDIEPWYARCHAVSSKKCGIVSLVPMDTAGWFDHVPGNAGIWHLKGRVHFDGAEQSGSKDSALHIWHPDYVGQFRVWDWKRDKFLI